VTRGDGAIYISDQPHLDDQDTVCRTYEKRMIFEEIDSSYLSGRYLAVSVMRNGNELPYPRVTLALKSPRNPVQYERSCQEYQSRRIEEQFLFGSPVGDQY
jgi:hypothetical protein